MATDGTAALRILIALAAVTLTATAAVLGAADTSPASPAALSAATFTTSEAGATAYSIPIPQLTEEQRQVFAEGKAQFNEAWVVAPDPGGVWGLGPTFNEDRCAHCHENNGSAQGPAEHGFAERGMLVRLSIPGATREGAPLPHPVYGDQLQNRGIQDRVPAEGRARFDYTEVTVAYADGETATLRKPQLQLVDLAFGDLGPGILTSPRIAPAMVGLGLLEAVPEATILGIAEEQAKRGLVHGKPNRVWDIENETLTLGRFGWKANQPNLRQQIAAAFHGDIGATTYMFPEENCPAAQTACLDVPSASKCGGQGGCTGNQYRPEVVPSRLSNITFYLQSLAVPARRNVDAPAFQRGEHLFEQAHCSACHVPELKTGKAALSAASNLVIRPYTDLLLHDMGEELADNRPDFQAGGREWRTPPLWGIGLRKVVNGHGDLLHDGRARDVAEAILWHGGEAQAAREAFRSMTKTDRQALVKFVESL